LLLLLLLLSAAVYTFGGKPVAGKVVTFTVTDSKTGAVKTYTGTTDANGVARVNVDASSLPAVANVYASTPSSKPDANGPVAATLAPGSGELLILLWFMRWFAAESHNCLKLNSSTLQHASK
jgi:hypothetical protein